ncbi:MAG TPA: 3-deoxy-manno-octulosonate cytidylyltransferase [Steroidobacteraceae bacterium]|jgi:3-deoxy-manno-octulosonate cytidylyltransferase (CMP-KDO synthetase)
MYRVVIPARFGSTRLPGKPLQPLAGKPMIQWVYERARRSGARQVIVATDDARIASAVREFGGEAYLTASTHASGTDRIAEVARREAWPHSDLIVNLQGDEPLMPEALIDQVAALLASSPGADLATLSVPLESLAALLDPNVVKVVTDGRQRALYFSRAPIPWSRDVAQGEHSNRSRYEGARRHLGLYAYRVAGLLQLSAWPPSPLEQIEKLEQLRALERGLDIRVADAVVAPGPDVNTAQDLAAVAALLEAGR